MYTFLGSSNHVKWSELSQVDKWIVIGSFAILIIGAIIYYFYDKHKNGE